ncbi:MAG: class I SAM-dependent methyltransferase [Defluviitaleaceae bacterium]|nr:class I SAM-dependent methyltransferase [Defluviitaleaceae bacterium]
MRKDNNIMLRKFISKNLAKPDGFVGKIVLRVLNRHNRLMYDEVIRLLDVGQGDVVLEAGCGNGVVLNTLAKRAGDASFVGIDISQSAVEAAIRQNKTFVKNGRMKVDLGDVAKLSFADELFTKVYTINTVYFWDDLNATMQEIYRVLRPNGVFINTLYTNETLKKYSYTQYGYKFFSTQELEQAGNNAGFAVKVIPIMDGAANCFIYMKQDCGLNLQ